MNHYFDSSSLVKVGYCREVPEYRQRRHILVTKFHLPINFQTSSLHDYC